MSPAPQESQLPSNFPPMSGNEIEGLDPDEFCRALDDRANNRRQFEDVWTDALVRSAYLAGPMRGIKNFNYPLFYAVAKFLRGLGYDIKNPAETDAEVHDEAVAAKNPLDVYMRRDLADVAATDAVFLLPGWEESQGATIEATVAFMLGHPVYELPMFERVESVRKATRDGAKDSNPNPKDVAASGKLPLHLWPTSATIYGTLALLEGALKYGRGNWRDRGVRASVYVDALARHVSAWFEGQDNAPDSGLPHLAHALACLAILVDAQMTGKLIDDRQFHGEGYRAFLDEATEHVARLKEIHADKAPHHFTIQDNEEAS